MSDVTDEQMDALAEDLAALDEEYGEPAVKSDEYLAKEADAWERHGHPEFAATLRGRLRGSDG